MQVNKTQSPSFGMFYSRCSSKKLTQLYKRTIRPIVRENKTLIDGLDKKNINLELYINNDQPSLLVGYIKGTKKLAKFKDGTEINVAFPTISGVQRGIKNFIEKAKELI